MTWTALSRSKVKGQGHQPALLTAVLTRQTTAAVRVGTYWPATLRSSRRREALRCPQREERGAAYGGGRPPTACYNTKSQTPIILDPHILSATYLRNGLPRLLVSKSWSGHLYRTLMLSTTIRLRLDCDSIGRAALCYDLLTCCGCYTTTSINKSA